ncbi:MAG TPA: hypothetical protein VKS24_25000 [Bradyrhizobium sp.]|nr:hypothetical protein [Bradyrhizobium sp.]
MKIPRFGFVGALAAAVTLAAAAAHAQQPTPILVPSIGANDIICNDIVNGQATPQDHCITAAILGNFAGTVPSGNMDNALIGGDFTTNLFQRGTTGSNVTTTLTYGAPDRFFAWDGGTGTQATSTLSRDTTAADIPADYKYAVKHQRTSAQTGLAQLCIGQVVESSNAYQFQSQTAEFDFHAAPGGNFSAAGDNVTAYIITGTVADEGAVNMAYGINTGGGGSGGWTGQVNWGVTVPVTSLNRFTIAAPVPAAAAEIGVALCWTPVGTAGTNDYVAYSGLQLTRNSALTPLVASNASGTATLLNSYQQPAARSFARRSQAVEIALQQRYYYEVDEVASSTAALPGICEAQSTTVAVCSIPLKVSMRAAPTVACTFGTLKRQVAGTDTALTACAAAATTNGVSTPETVFITATVASGDTAGLAGVLMSGNSTGGGKITASAEE